MRLGISFTQTSTQQLSRAELIENARLSEELGFAGVWFFDAMGRQGGMHPDPLIAASVSAAVTDQIEVGTCVMQVPLRRAAELAQRVLTTQMACDGRFTFGVGAGSTKTDFDLLGLDFDARMKTLRQSLHTMRALWNGESVNGVGLNPWAAVRGGPPVLIGSWGGSIWIPRAAQEYDGWIGSGAKSNWAALTSGIERFRGLGGKRAIVTNIHCTLGDSDSPWEDDKPFNLNCSPKEARRRLQMIADLGYDDAILMLPRRDRATLEELRALWP